MTVFDLELEDLCHVVFDQRTDVEVAALTAQVDYVFEVSLEHGALDISILTTLHKVLKQFMEVLHVVPELVLGM